MKLFTFLFALYILLLTGVPCCVIDNCEDEHPTTEQADHHSDCEKDKGCNNCSPFFSCHSCCGFIVQERIVVYNNTPEVYVDNEDAVYLFSYHGGYVASLLQPPRIS